jgi:hypothetical protein
MDLHLESQSGQMVDVTQFTRQSGNHVFFDGLFPGEHSEQHDWINAQLER